MRWCKNTRDSAGCHNTAKRRKNCQRCPRLLWRQITKVTGADRQADQCCNDTQANHQLNDCKMVARTVWSVSWMLQLRCCKFHSKLAACRKSCSQHGETAAHGSNCSFEAASQQLPELLHHKQKHTLIALNGLRLSNTLNLTYNVTLQYLIPWQSLQNSQTGQPSTGNILVK